MKRSWIVLFVPVGLAFIGGLANAIVCAANGGHMPVLWPGGCELYPKDKDIVHICMTAHTHLNWLADWMVNNSGVSSLGDRLIDLGGELVPASILAWFGMTLQYFKKEK